MFYEILESWDKPNLPSLVPLRPFIMFSMFLMSLRSGELDEVGGSDFMLFGLTAKLGGVMEGGVMEWGGDTGGLLGWFILVPSALKAEAIPVGDPSVEGTDELIDDTG